MHFGRSLPRSSAATGGPTDRTSTRLPRPSLIYVPLRSLAAGQNGHSLSIVPARKAPSGEPDDRFGSALDERLAKQAPLAARMRPRTLDEIVGQRHLVGPDAPLRALIESDRLSSVILWGPPGTGKT